MFSSEQIYVVTLRDQAAELQAQVPEIPLENFLCEPEPRGTASVIGYAAVVLQRKDPDSVMAVLTADHFIGGEERFRKLLRTAYLVAGKNFLVTLGIKPTFPATAYGYIQYGDYLETIDDQPVFRMARFVEKPGEDQAADLISHGGYAWNSGMFVWKTERILNEMRRQIPEVAAELVDIGLTHGTPAGEETLARVWSKIPIETIDYAIMEGAVGTAVIPADGLDWSDIGSWDALFNVIPGDKDGNIIIGGEHTGLDTHQTLVYMAQKHRLIVTIGIDNLVVVDTGDVLLVCNKNQAQNVRYVVNQLRLNGQEVYLIEWWIKI